MRSVLDKEQSCLDGVPENLQDSRQAERFEEAVEVLESAEEDIESAINAVREVI